MPLREPNWKIILDLKFTLQLCFPTLYFICHEKISKRLGADHLAKELIKLEWFSNKVCRFTTHVVKKWKFIYSKDKSQKTEVFFSTSLFHTFSLIRRCTWDRLLTSPDEWATTKEACRDGESSPKYITLCTYVLSTVLGVGKAETLSSKWTIRYLWHFRFCLSYYRPPPFLLPVTISWNFCRKHRFLYTKY